MDARVLLYLLDIFVILGLTALAYVYIHKIIALLQSKHPQLYNDLDRPRAKFNIKAYQFGVYQFSFGRMMVAVLKGRLAHTDDLLLNSLSSGLRILYWSLVGSVVFLLVLVVAFPI